MGDGGLYESFDTGPVQDTEQVNVETRQIIQALKIDFEFFIEFFLGEQIDLGVPAFHNEIWGYMTDQSKERILLAIPRDHAKTTLAKLSVIWHWLFTHHRFCVYLSNTNAIAKGACKDIIEFLSHPNFIQVFGRAKEIKSSENESLWIYEIIMPGGKPKRLILRAVGQGQQMRGINIDNQRPDFTVVDDVEDNDNTGSELLQKKLDKWIFGPFLKALARRKKILWLGNMLTKTSLLARLSRNPKWNPVVFGAIVRDTINNRLVPLWPEKWSLAQLIEDFKEYQDMGLVESWMCEMMNMPGFGENGFAAESINYWAVGSPDEYIATWITVDPAFGQNAANDETAVAVHGIHRDTGQPGTIAIAHGRVDEHEMFRIILGQALYWNAWVWGVEAVAAQRVLISLFHMLLAPMMLNHHIEILPLMSGRGDPKVSRIRSFVALMGKKDWAIPSGDFDITTQILLYDQRKKDQEDDIIDACAYGPMMMEQYGPIIRAIASGQDVKSGATHQIGTEVEGV
jgi:hypothetical protein